MLFVLSLMQGFKTCYAWQRIGDRSPELTKEYVALITRYRDRGIISQAAYRKIVKGLETDREGL